MLIQHDVEHYKQEVNDWDFPLSCCCGHAQIQQWLGFLINNLLNGTMYQRRSFVVFFAIIVCIVLAVCYFYRGSPPQIHSGRHTSTSQPKPLCTGPEGNAELCSSESSLAGGIRQPQRPGGHLLDYTSKATSPEAHNIMNDTKTAESHEVLRFPPQPAVRAGGRHRMSDSRMIKTEDNTNFNIHPVPESNMKQSTRQSPPRISKPAGSANLRKGFNTNTTVRKGKKIQAADHLTTYTSNNSHHRATTERDSLNSLHQNSGQKAIYGHQTSKSKQAYTGTNHNQIEHTSSGQLYTHGQAPITSLPTRHPNQVDSQYGYGYVITQTYGGQMTRAIKNMMLQQCWAGTVGNPLHIVEPFSSESNLFHSPKFWDALEHNRLHEAATFSEYYDLDYFNELSLKEKGASVVKWDNFLQNAPRTAVVVTIPPGGCKSLSNSVTNDQGIQHLSTSQCKVSRAYEEFLRGLLGLNFSFVKKLCVDCSKLQRPLTLAELENEVYGGRNVSETTVIFSGWRNFQVVGSWLQLPSYCVDAQKPDSSTRLIPSASVLNHTNYYRNNILRGKRVIAVMLRVERFLTLKRMGRSNESVESCLKKTVKLHDRLLQTQTFDNSSTFLTLDIGRFGSGIMQDPSVVAKLGQDSLSSIGESVVQTLEHLYNGEWTMTSWEQSFVKATSGIVERGYIAMLQRSIATHSDCLILMGGGSFQQVAAYQYMKHHQGQSKPCLYSVCATESFSRSITRAHA